MGADSSSYGSSEVPAIYILHNYPTTPIRFTLNGWFSQLGSLLISVHLMPLAKRTHRADHYFLLSIHDRSPRGHHIVVRWSDLPFSVAHSSCYFRSLIVVVVILRTQKLRVKAINPFMNCSESSHFLPSLVKVSQHSCSLVAEPLLSWGRHKQFMRAF